MKINNKKKENVIDATERFIKAMKANTQEQPTWAMVSSAFMCGFLYDVDNDPNFNLINR